MTGKDHDARFEQRAFNKLHLNKRYYRTYKKALSSGPVSDYSDKTFASGLLPKFAYHRYIYYPRDVVSGDRGYLHGIALGHHNNRATKKTTKDFAKYIRNKLLVHPNKRYNRYFHRHYSNRFISEGSGIGDGYNGSNYRYRVSNRHLKHSTIYYNMPMGPENFVPTT